MTTNKKGRPLRQQPKTAYDVRRYLTLVQVLAMEGSDEPIRHLCESWGVEPVLDLSTPPYKGRHYLNVWSTIHELAKHVIEYHRSGDDA